MESARHYQRKWNLFINLTEATLPVLACKYTLTLCFYSFGCCLWKTFANSCACWRRYGAEVSALLHRHPTPFTRLHGVQQLAANRVTYPFILRYLIGSSLFYSQTRLTLYVLSMSLYAPSPLPQISLGSFSFFFFEKISIIVKSGTSKIAAIF